MEYSIHAPIEQQTDIATTDGRHRARHLRPQRLAAGRASVEFPLGSSPKYMQHFERYAGHLYMEDEGDGSKARVRWLKIHTLGESSTIPAEHEEIIVLGATGYLAMSASAYTVDRATIAGSQATINYKAWGMERLQRYDKKLKQVARGNRVIQRELYTEE